jgi:putative DNA primase/helicase
MIPTEVRVATEEYRAESDILPQFISDSCIKEKSSKESSKSLYDAYRGWAEENTDEILKPKAFGVLLKIAGFKPSKSDGVRYWNGLRLKPKEAQSNTMEVPGQTGAIATATSGPTAAASIH